MTSQVKPWEVPFDHTFSNISVAEVEIGDFIMIDIGPDRNPHSGWYSEVIRVLKTGDHVVIATRTDEGVYRYNDQLRYLRRIK